MFESIWQYILNSLLLGLVQFSIILISGILPFVILTIVAVYFNSVSLTRLVEIFGPRVFLVTGWLGVPVHEFSHLIAALISGHKITKFQPFTLNDSSGQLGVVKSSYSKSNWYQRFVGGFLIPIAPIIGGTFLLYIIIYYLFPSFKFVSSVQFKIPHSEDYDRMIPWLYYMGQIVFTILLTLKNLWNSIFLNDWKTYLGFYGIICISLHLFPSSTDWKNFRFSLRILIILAFLGSVIFSFLQLANTSIVIWTTLLFWTLPVWFFTIGITVVVSVFVLLLTWVLNLIFH